MMRVSRARIVKTLRLGSALAYAWRVEIGTGDAPLYLDVGARGGLSKPWDVAARLGMIHPVLIEPDHTEAQRLSARYPSAMVLPYALGSANGMRTLHLTRERGRSSLLRPNECAVSRFGAEAWTVESEIEVEVVRLDSVWRGPPPSIVKVDVQGLELDVLLGMGDLLEGVICIEAESSFVPFYVGQPQFHDLFAVLFQRGFDLVKLRPLGLYDGALLEFNAFFVRRSKHKDPLVCWWKRMSDVGTQRRIVTFGY